MVSSGLAEASSRLMSEILDAARAGSQPHTKLIVIQPTALCNLNCRYCYVPNRRDASRMSPETLGFVANRVFTSPFVRETIEFLWHSGEPLTVGPAYYRDAIRIISEANRNGIDVRHSIQTNGTLINDEWCTLFREHDIRIGVSIDGPAFVHDGSRKDWAGRGSHADALRGLRLLGRNGIPFGVLCVLTSQSLDHATEIFDFLRSQGVTSAAFNLEETEGANRVTSFGGEDFASLAGRYTKFMSTLFDAHSTCRSEISFREFSKTVGILRSIRVDEKFQNVLPEARDFGILTVRRDGSVTAFSPEFASMDLQTHHGLTIGNVSVQTFAQMFESGAYRRMKGEIDASIDGCRKSCAHFRFCGGAFFSNKLSEHGSLRATETRSCRIHLKALTNLVIEKMTVTHS